MSYFERRHRRVDGFRALVVPLLEQVRVDAKRNRRISLAEPLADPYHVEPGVNQQARVSVSQSVECNTGQADGFRYVRPSTR